MAQELMTQKTVIPELLEVLVDIGSGDATEEEYARYKVLGGIPD